MTMEEEWVRSYIQSFNEEKNYILCHHISREMLMKGHNKDLAKCLATLSALMEQANQKKWSGFEKLYATFFEQIHDLKGFPYKQEKLLIDLQALHNQIHQAPEVNLLPIYLEWK